MTAVAPRLVMLSRHLAEVQSVFGALPPSVNQIFARADAGFYCWDAVEAYEKQGVQTRFEIGRAHV